MYRARVLFHAPNKNNIVFAHLDSAIGEIAASCEYGIQVPLERRIFRLDMCLPFEATIAVSQHSTLAGDVNPRSETFSLEHTPLLCPRVGGHCFVSTLRLPAFNLTHSRFRSNTNSPLRSSSSSPSFLGSLAVASGWSKQASDKGATRYHGTRHPRRKRRQRDAQKERQPHERGRYREHTCNYRCNGTPSTCTLPDASTSHRQVSPYLLFQHPDSSTTRLFRHQPQHARKSNLSDVSSPQYPAVDPVLRPPIFPFPCPCPTGDHRHPFPCLPTAGLHHPIHHHRDSASAVVPPSSRSRSRYPSRWASAASGTRLRCGSATSTAEGGLIYVS